MTKRTPSICFGVVAGAAWSLLPAYLSELAGSPADWVLLLAAGVITGTAVAHMLHLLSEREGLPLYVLLLLSPVVLCVSGFLFGLLLDLGSLMAPDSLIRRRLGVRYFGYYGYWMMWVALWFVFLPLVMFTIFLQWLVMGHPRSRS